MLEGVHTDNLGLFGPSGIEGGKIFREPLRVLGGLQERRLIVNREVLDGLVCGTSELSGQTGKVCSTYLDLCPGSVRL